MNAGFKTMKKIIFIVLLIYLFIIVFFDSDTLEVQVETKDRGGVIYLVRKHSIHWDRFFNYIKDTPRRILDSLSF